MRIAVVAPSCTLKREAADAVQAIVAAARRLRTRDPPAMFPVRRAFRRTRRSAVGCAARSDGRSKPSTPSGSRAAAMAPTASPRRRLQGIPDAARSKLYLGYSDAGFLLAGFHKAGLDVAWGPMPQDVLRAGGDAAINRALDWIVRRDPLVAGARSSAARHGVQPDGSRDIAWNRRSSPTFPASTC